MTDTEKALAGIWRELLRLETVGITDDFFALGGHSLLATQFVSRARKLFPVDFSVAHLFREPDIKRLAERIDTMLWAARSRGESAGVAGEGEEEIVL